MSVDDASLDQFRVIEVIPGNCINDSLIFFKVDISKTKKNAEFLQYLHIIVENNGSALTNLSNNCQGWSDLSFLQAIFLSVFAYLLYTVTD